MFQINPFSQSQTVFNVVIVVFHILCLLFLSYVNENAALRLLVLKNQEKEKSEDTLKLWNRICDFPTFILKIYNFNEMESIANDMFTEKQ